MSLYNMLFGVEPTAGIALKMLGIAVDDVPRFRDAYFTWSDDGETDPVIVVHTRTGGGNREDYENENAVLTLISGYRHDEDCDYDCTYADFYFSVPDSVKQAVIEFLKAKGKPMSGGEKFDAAIKAIKNS